jgi:hypothetical protein
MEIEKLKSAGRNFTIIGYTMVVGVFLSLAQLMILFNSRNIESIQSTSIVFTILYITCTIVVIINMINAGKNLMSSSDDLDEYVSPINIVGTPLEINDLLIAQYDISKKMNWNDAKNACSELGDGWRLPTKEELNYMFQNRDFIKGFTKNIYWSSNESSVNIDWGQALYLSVNKYYASKDGRGYARAVKFK